MKLPYGPGNCGLHAVRSLMTLYDPMHDVWSFQVRWWDNSYWSGIGAGIRDMFEDVEFDLKGLLDEKHGEILDTIGWTDWTWQDLPA